MEKLCVAACDDDRVALDIIASSLKGCLARRGADAEVYTYASVSALQADMNRIKFNLLLLDIEMAGMDGIAFARQLRENGNKVDIIFISNREDRIFDALKNSPRGFIRKSRFLEDMAEIMGAYLACRQKQEAAPKLVIRMREEIIGLPIDQIRYIEGNRNTQMIHAEVQTQPIPLRRPMQELENELAPQGFLRIHKGYLVNYRCIRAIRETEVQLQDGTLLPLSRRKMPEVKNSYLRWVQNENEMLF